MNNVQGGQDGVFLDEQSAGNTVSTNNVLGNEIDINNAKRTTNKYQFQAVC